MTTGLHHAVLASVFLSSAHRLRCERSDKDCDAGNVLDGAHVIEDGERDEECGGFPSSACDRHG